MKVKRLTGIVLILYVYIEPQRKILFQGVENKKT